jgi:O-antigen/teichoic acid export membrane protein
LNSPQPTTLNPQLSGQWPRLKQWSLRLAEFGFVQGLVQLLGAVAGLLIVRTLTKQEYALYAIANSMQTAGNMLADLGIGIGLRSIGGRVWNDRQRFGQLLNTALGLRKRFAVVALGVTLPVAAWMLWRNGASTVTLILLTAAIAAAVIPLLSSGVWNASLQLHGEYRRIQKLDFANAALRLVMLGGLALTKMNALLAVVVGAIGNWFQVFWQRRWVREKSDSAAPLNSDDRREMLRLSRKWMPNVIFYCLQGQITLLILTLFGNTTGVADITALGRIAMLFAVFSVTFGNVLAPRFARCQDPKRLPRLYLLLVGGTVLVLAPMLLVAWLFPESFLWLLGDKYVSLGNECGWVVAAGCVTQVCAVVFTLNSSKAWIRFQSWGFIPAILGAQVIAALLLDLRQFHDVLIFNLVSAAAPLPIYAADAWHGMKRNPQTQ